MVKISQIAFGKVDFTRTNTTTRVPKTAIQTFQTHNKTDYTTIVKENKYAAQIEGLKTKFEDIEPEYYVNEAANNGFRMLVVSDSDYKNFGARWDEAS